MRRAVLGAMTGRRFGMLMAFLAVVAAGPRFARAGCSSYFTAERSTAPGLSASLELLGAVGVLASPASEGPRPRPLPCTGPTCSEAPGLPASPTPPDVTAGVEQWAMPSMPTPRTNPERSDRSSSDPRCWPEARPRTIFHPPRSTAA